MRVITGTARGKKLETLSGDDVRPTTEKTKEAVFSAIQFDIEGRRILDLFAGSGQLGIEALSRGAEHAVFCDISKKSLEVVKRNLESTGFGKKAVAMLTSYDSYLKLTKDKFDIAFLDPPYAAGVLLDALSLTANAITEHGIIVCEHPDYIELPETIEHLKKTKTYKYGKTVFVTIYRGITD